MPYQTSLSVSNLKSRGHSTAFNPRNLEHDWYPVWNEVFIDIKSLLSDVYIYPQYYLWLRDSEYLPLTLRERMVERLDPNEDGVTHPLDDADRALVPLQADFGDAYLAQLLASSEPIDGDTSFGSEITVSGSPKDLRPDFSFTHLTTRPLHGDRATSAYGNNRAGRKILHECHFVICEVKAAPSRQLSELAKMDALAGLFGEAQDDLAMYANRYFLADGGLRRDKLLLWACVGAFWTWVSVSREDVPAWNWKRGSFAFGANPSLFYSMFSEPFELCTPDSDAQINFLVTHYFQPDQIHEPNDRGDLESGSDHNMNEG
ncbi:hypothetical protein BDP27DRAFT_1453091 [Rhodocollybia butyracea]|uniref:Uncharacterized protein n=1 Tax=Rhodocollybia butyracea TaxID=206335 RepID=A0A9P5PAB6_9AGAR|nr:hypothetical protein BDP27DRAFT_1453091 [Rhodocollybia butyracea]